MKLKLISDNTNAGTYLIDENTGNKVPYIQKISWEAKADDYLTTVKIELVGIPVEITTKAKINGVNQEVKIISPSPHYGKNFATTACTQIINALTNQMIGLVQKIKWSATPTSRRTKIETLELDPKPQGVA